LCFATVSVVSKLDPERAHASRDSEHLAGRLDSIRGRGVEADKLPSEAELAENGIVEAALNVVSSSVARHHAEMALIV